MNMQNKNKEVFDTEIFRQKILFLLKNDKQKVAEKMMKNIAFENYLSRDDMRGLYDCFSPIFDELFYDMMFENIKIQSSTKELLEKLALPLFKMEKQEQETVIQSFQ